MKKNKLNDKGFAHLSLLLIAAILSVSGWTLYRVANANHRSPKSSQSLSSGATTQNKISSSLSTTSKAPTTTTSKSSPSATQPKTTTKTTTTSGGSSTPSTATSTSNSSSSAPATPLSVLTSLITDVKNGAQANVTANSVTVPGPISNASARPIVFTANGQTYFAYTQGSAPNFSLSASSLANSMAIVSATVSSPALVQAHLDKSDNLVDPNFALVGYSTGGN